MGPEINFVRRDLTEQVADSLRELIEHGELSANSRLLSSRDLAKRYGVSHNVMLKALKQLQHDAVIVLPSKRRGYHIKH